MPTIGITEADGSRAVILASKAAEPQRRLRWTSASDHAKDGAAPRGQAEGGETVHDGYVRQLLEAGQLNGHETPPGARCLRLEPHDEVHRLFAGVCRHDESSRSGAALERDGATGGARNAQRTVAEG